MNRRTIIISLLLIVVLLAGVSESSARSKYFHSLITVYGDGSCGTCHFSASGGGPRNSYGTLFESQANHATDPAAALTAIGPPPTASSTFNPAATSTTEPAATLTETPVQTASTPIATETPTIPAATVTEKTTVTPAAAGFGIGLSLVGLFVSALLVRRNNK